MFIFRIPSREISTVRKWALYVYCQNGPYDQIFEIQIFVAMGWFTFQIASDNISGQSTKLDSKIPFGRTSLKCKGVVRNYQKFLQIVSFPNPHPPTLYSVLKIQRTCVTLLSVVSRDSKLKANTCTDVWRRKMETAIVKGKTEWKEEEERVYSRATWRSTKRETDMHSLDRRRSTGTGWTLRPHSHSSSSTAFSIHVYLQDQQRSSSARHVAHFSTGLKW